MAGSSSVDRLFDNSDRHRPAGAGKIKKLLNSLIIQAIVSKIMDISLIISIDDPGWIA